MLAATSTTNAKEWLVIWFIRLSSLNQQPAVANALGSFASVCRCRDLGISLGAMPTRFVLT